MLGSFFTSLLKITQIVVDAIEAFFPNLAVTIEPIVDLLEPISFEPAWTPLRLAAAGDQTGALQHFEMPGDGRTTYIERLGQFVNGCLTRGQARQDGAPRRIGKGCKVKLRFWSAGHFVS